MIEERQLFDTNQKLIKDLKLMSCQLGADTNSDLYSPISMSDVMNVLIHKNKNFQTKKQEKSNQISIKEREKYNSKLKIDIHRQNTLTNQDFPFLKYEQEKNLKSYPKIELMSNAVKKASVIRENLEKNKNILMREQDKKKLNSHIFQQAKQRDMIIYHYTNENYQVKLKSGNFECFNNQILNQNLKDKIDKNKCLYKQKIKQKTSIHQQIEEKITEFYREQKPKSFLIDILRQITNIRSRRNSIFLKLMIYTNQLLLEAKPLSNCFAYAVLKKLQNQYYVSYTDNTKKANRQYILRSSLYLNTLDVEENFRKQMMDSLIFWCKNLMAFFTGQGDQISKSFINKGYNQLAIIVNKYYERNELIQQEILVVCNNQLFQKNPFYKILVKLLIKDFSFDSFLGKILYQQELQIIQILKLRENPHYSQNQNFVLVKKQLIQYIKNPKKQNDDIQQICRKLVHYISIDQIYQLFTQYQIPSIQLIFVLFTFLQSQQLRIFSAKTDQFWANQILRQTSKIIKQTKSHNIQQKFVIILKCLQIYSHYVSQHQLQQNIVTLLTENVVVLQAFINQNFKFSLYLTANFGLSITVLDKITLRSLSLHRNYYYFFERYISQLIPLTQIRITNHKSVKTFRQINAHRSFINKLGQSTRVIQNLQQFSQQNIQQIKTKQYVFLEGLKVINSDLMNIFLGNGTSSKSEDQQGHLQEYKMVMKIVQQEKMQIENLNLDHEMIQEYKEFIQVCKEYVHLSNFLFSTINAKKCVKNSNIENIDSTLEWITNQFKRKQDVKIVLRNLYESICELQNGNPQKALIIFSVFIHDIIQVCKISSVRRKGFSRGKQPLLSGVYMFIQIAIQVFKYLSPIECIRYNALKAIYQEFKQRRI